MSEEQHTIPKKWYQSAMVVQDAVNLSGVVTSFRAALDDIWKEAHANGHGTDWVNRHPISVLFASKVADLARSEPFSNYSDAYVAVQAAIDKPGGE